MTKSPITHQRAKPNKLQNLKLIVLELTLVFAAGLAAWAAQWWYNLQDSNKRANA